MNIKLSENIRIDLSKEVSSTGKIQIQYININNVKYNVEYSTSGQSFRNYIESLIDIKLDIELDNYFVSNKDNKVIYNEVKFYGIPKRPSEVIKDTYIQLSYEKIMQGIVIIYKSTDTYFSHRNDTYIEYDLINGTFNQPIIYKLIPMRDLQQMLIMYQYDQQTAPKHYIELIDLLKWFNGKKSVWIVKFDGTKQKLEDLYTMALSRYDLSKVESFRYKRENFYISDELSHAIPN